MAQCIKQVEGQHFGYGRTGAISQLFPSLRCQTAIEMYVLGTGAVVKQGLNMA